MSKFYIFFVFIGGLFLFQNCGKGNSTFPTGSLGCGAECEFKCSGQTTEELESNMRSMLSSATTDADFSMILESSSKNRSFVFERGSSKVSKTYESASTSKWVTAVVVLSLVDRGFLSLDSKPQDFISFWAPGAANPMANITLRQLLSFISGVSVEPICINLAGGSIESCVQTIYNNNISNGKTPGAEFYYSSAHMQVAGLMAIKARGLNSWDEVFSEFKLTYGLFANSTYNLPSMANPRLAGGMTWTATDYNEFLKKLITRQILPQNLLDEMWSDQISNSIVANSPALDGLGEQWHYGLGQWVECASANFNCSRIDRVSSPGAYGAYPFIDFQYGYHGILARQGVLGTSANGVTLFRKIQIQAAQWASCN